MTQATSTSGDSYQAGYDGFGRRAWQKVNGTKRYFLYDGDTLIAEVNANGNLVAEYTWGLLGPLMRRPSNVNNIRYYIQDGLGHTRALLDNAGNVTDWYVYEAWGGLNNSLSSTNTANSLRWNGAYGYEWIPSTGLYHVGAREYDPRTGRWLQRDPIDVASGDPHLYRYCGNDPVNQVDPDGLIYCVGGRCNYDTTAEWSHGFLDFMGMAPIVGPLADLGNAFVYTNDRDVAVVLKDFGQGEC